MRLSRTTDSTAPHGQSRGASGRRALKRTRTDPMRPVIRRPVAAWLSNRSQRRVLPHTARRTARHEDHEPVHEQRVALAPSAPMACRKSRDWGMWGRSAPGTAPASRRRSGSHPRPHEWQALNRPSAEPELHETNSLRQYAHMQESGRTCEEKDQAALPDIKVQLALRWTRGPMDWEDGGRARGPTHWVCGSNSRKPVGPSPAFCAPSCANQCTNELWCEEPRRHMRHKLLTSLEVKPLQNMHT